MPLLTYFYICVIASFQGQFNKLIFPPYHGLYFPATVLDW